MNRQIKVINDLNYITTRIQGDFPEFYPHVDKTPIHPVSKGMEMNIMEFDQSMDSIQLQASVAKRIQRIRKSPSDLKYLRHYIKLVNLDLITSAV